jgi:Protein of unknown function (DUF742)
VSADDSWLDAAAGPVVRPYAIIGGRTQPADSTLELVAMVAVTDRGLGMLDQITGEHQEILRRCRKPQSIAELSAYLNVPLGVGRVLVSDLLDLDLVVVGRPGARHRKVDQALLEKVMHGLSRL